MLAIVTVSYRQTIKAYPMGASSYIVASDNLGDRAGILAASALLIGYTVTVAVSVSAGVAAMTSIIPQIYDYRVWISVALVALLMLGNLRGIRESGSIFMTPTYLYVVVMLGVIAVGLVQAATGQLAPFDAPQALDRRVERHRPGARVAPHPARVLAGRGGADRRRGRLRRRSRVQAAGVEERADHADLGGRHLRHPLRGDRLPGHRHRHRARSR